MGTEPREREEAWSKLGAGQRRTEGLPGKEVQQEGRGHEKAAAQKEPARGVVHVGQELGGRRTRVALAQGPAHAAHGWMWARLVAVKGAACALVSFKIISKDLA